MVQALNFDVGVYDPATRGECVKGDVAVFSVFGLRGHSKSNSISYAGDSARRADPMTSEGC